LPLSISKKNLDNEILKYLQIASSVIKFDLN
jgi:hypothetical protein